MFPTPPHENRSGYLNAFDEDSKADDEYLLFPMETPISPPYIVRPDIVVLSNPRSDVNVDANTDPDAKATSDLLKGLGIRVTHEGSQISIKRVATAAAYKGDDLDRTFLFDEEVGVGEAKFQSFLTTELDEESELESEPESDLDDYFN